MLIPSIDVSGGRAVQLRRGKELVITSERDPRDLAREFGRTGEIAVIDLDAARGVGDNLPLIEDLCAIAPCRVGGGIRDLERAQRLLRAGARRLIVGTRAEPVFLSRLPQKRLLAAVDAVGDQVTDHGWTFVLDETPIERVRHLTPYVAGFLYTNVDREGTESGIDMKRVVELARATSRPVTAAGGVRSVEEVVELDRMGVDAQVGMALYKGYLTPAACLAAVLDFSKNGDVIPTVVQDARDGRVLLVAHSTGETLRESVDTGDVVLHSRRRGRWRKGEESGNTQRLVRVEVDCDRDALLFLVEPAGPACHKGTQSCFGDRPFSLSWLERIVAQRSDATMKRPSYTRTLLGDPSLRRAKLLEEAAELADATSRENARWEAADLFYHALVAMRAAGVTLPEVAAELEARNERRE